MKLTMRRNEFRNPECYSYRYRGGCANVCFDPTVGIVEGSATGTAAGPLACQLINHGIVKDGATMVIEQGYEMKRTSLLRVEVQEKVVRLGGRGVKVIEGTLRIE
jgi:trans-2,3-dihydro-3-hydroxyanthranilate isomerase